MKNNIRFAAIIGTLAAFCLSGCSDGSEELPTDTLPPAMSSESSAFSDNVSSVGETSTAADSVSESDTISGTGSDTETSASSDEISSADVNEAEGNSSGTDDPADTSASETESETEPPETSSVTAPPVTQTVSSVSPATVPTVPDTEAPAIPQTSALPSETAVSTSKKTADTKKTVSNSGNTAKKEFVSYADFFSESLFIGDSICSGLKIYGGLLPTENVAARINVSTWGINKYTFQYKTNSTAEMGAYQIAELYQPEDIYIWMGMNDLYVVSEDKFCENLNTIADNLLAVSPGSRIYVVSISPMTSWHKWNRELDGNNKVNKYNAAAEKYCEESDTLTWINIHDALIDTNGCLAEANNGGDGIHLSPSAYKIVLDTIVEFKQNEYIPEPEPEQTETEITETEPPVTETEKTKTKKKKAEETETVSETSDEETFADVPETEPSETETTKQKKKTKKSKPQDNGQ